jgi:hypothetical protein
MTDRLRYNPGMGRDPALQWLPEAQLRATLSEGIALQIAADLGRGITTDELIDEIERFDADRPGNALMEAAMRDQQIPVELARAFIVVYMRTWEPSGRRSMLNLVELPPLTGDPGLRRRILLAFECAQAMADPRDDERWAELPGLLEEIAVSQDGDGRPVDAANMRLIAAQVATDPTEMIQFAERCAIAGSKAGDLELLRRGACLRAIGFQRARVAGVVSDLEVFDAMDAAVRHLAMTDPPETELLEAMLREAPQFSFFENLVPALVPVLRAAEVADEWQLPPFDEDEAPIELSRVAWNVSLERLAEDLVPRVLRHAVQLELDRSSLEDDRTDQFAHAEWSSWSFQYAGYSRAVPHGSSLERERDRDDIFLLIHHETTHVISMTGAIGAAVMALRAAALELELDLWAAHKQIDQATFVAEGVTPLGLPGMPTLVWAGYQLDILAKMNALQDVWNPWFEGLAIFAELCDNPTADDTSTTAADVLTQLIDVRDEAGETAEQRQRAFTDIRDRFDRKIKQVQRDLGPVKLQYYCESMSAKYMAGFMAVRSVLAAWRRSVGELRGHTAIRLLQHITRFSTYSLAVPDLSLEPDQFTAAAQEAMISWIRRIAELPADEIRFVTGNPQTDFRWVNQRVSSSKHMVNRADEMTKLYHQMVHQALQPAESRGRKSKLYFADDLLDDWSRLLSVLPLGQATARFWVNSESGHLVYVVRTMEHRMDNDQPSYDLSTVPLDGEEIDALKTAVIAHPFDRLTIARFADLLNDPNALGRNVMAFRLGDWVHIQAHGWQFGSFEQLDQGIERAIRLRLNPSIMLKMEKNFIDPADGAVTRTAQWAGADWSTSDEPALPVEVQEAAEKLAAQAAEIRDHVGTANERAASQRLMAAILGTSEEAADLVDHGLAALTPYEPDLRTSAYTALLISGDAPADAELSLPDDHPLRALLVHGEAGWDVVPVTGEPGTGS